MGKTSTHKHKGTRGHKYSHKTARDGKFNLPHADVLYKGLQEVAAAAAPLKPLEINEDLPGLGQFYCNVSGRYFETQEALDSFRKSKPYRRGLKRLLAAPPHTQADAEAAAGMGKPKNN